MGEEYLPHFCPNCGYHLNEVALAPKKEYGCGHCHGSHDTLDDIKVCGEAMDVGITMAQARVNRHNREQARHAARIEDIKKMARELSDD